LSTPAGAVERRPYKIEKRGLAAGVVERRPYKIEKHGLHLGKEDDNSADGSLSVANYEASLGLP
jgi:uncharacterized protein YjhX (UPF0386 family)